MPLGTTVTNKTLPSFGANASTLGTAGVVGELDYGPEAPTLTRSINELASIFGTRTATNSTIYDWAELFFALGGRRLWIKRPLNGGAAAAKLELEAGSTAKTLTIEAKYKGTYGNKLKIATIENAGKTKTKLVVYGPEGEVLQESGEYAKAEELLKWGEEEAHKAFVVIGQGSAYSSGKGELVKALASKVLSGGTNPTALSEVELVTGLAAFTNEYGPMRVAIPSKTGQETHEGLANHAATHEGRRAVGDFTDNATPGTLIAEKGLGSLSATTQGYIAFTSSTVIISGIVPGTTRKVAGSAALCALGAQLAATNGIAGIPNMNQATAGANWTISPFVLGFTNTFTHSQQEELVEHGINVWGEELGELCLIGFVSGVSRETDEIFWSEAAGMERLQLDYEGNRIMAAFNYKTITLRLIAACEGRLQGLILKHWENGALYGETATSGPNAAGSVQMGEPINTVTTSQKGELNAQLQFKPAEYAQSTALLVIARPLSANVNQ